MNDIIERLQTEFDRAELTGDQEAVREFLAHGFRAIGPRGFVLDADAWVGRLTRFRYLTLESSELDVQFYGEMTAIVRCIQRNRSTHDGQSMEFSNRMSATWVKQGSEWRLAGVQFSPWEAAASERGEGA